MSYPTLLLNCSPTVRFSNIGMISIPNISIKCLCVGTTAPKKKKLTIQADAFTSVVNNFQISCQDWFLVFDLVFMRCRTYNAPCGHKSEYNRRGTLIKGDEFTCTPLQTVSLHSDVHHYQCRSSIIIFDFLCLHLFGFALLKLPLNTAHRLYPQ